MDQVIQHLRRAVLRQDGAGLTDGQLLGCFIEQRDGAAFAGLVRRHGPMVWGVCRRVLSNHHDAEDAFQATFLVLARKAASVRPREMVVNWLYGVARQTALKARAAAAKRRSREKQVRVMPEAEAPRPGLWRDLRPLLDQELSRLPAKYRAPILLCDLEGKTRREAARQLGVPDGTLSARLARARVMLAKRLSRHDLAMAGGALAAVLARDAAAGVPPGVTSSTLKATSLWAAGRAVTGLVPAPAAALAEEVVKTMLLTKLKITTAVLLAVAFAGAGRVLYPTRAAAQDDRPATAANAQEGVREAAIKALERFAASQRAADREAAVKALAEFGKELRAADKAGPREAAGAGLFKHRVRFQTGFTEFTDGSRIDITEVWGTRPQIEVGGQYLVRGKYVLPSHDRGKLYFYETTQDWVSVGPELDLQTADVKKGRGEFTLVHGMAGPGYFHLYLMGGDHPVANVYFGTGDNVLRRKP